MAHYAQIDNNNIVLQVIVADQDYIDSGQAGDPTRWIQTSYNTHGGVHSQGGVPLRKNYASIGYTYDPQRDAFIPPKDYPSWVLDNNTCLWYPPLPLPADAGTGTPPKSYYWDESVVNWVAREPEDPTMVQPHATSPF